MRDDVVVVRIVGGRLAPESWVYAVLGGGGEVLHVGATGLPPAVRTWLHLEHDDPTVARLRALDTALLEDAVVVATAGPEGVDRAAVRDRARSRLATGARGDGRRAEDHADPGAGLPPEVSRACASLERAVADAGRSRAPGGATPLA